MPFILKDCPGDKSCFLGVLKGSGKDQPEPGVCEQCDGIFGCLSRMLSGLALLRSLNGLQFADSLAGWWGKVMFVEFCRIC